MAAQGPSAVMAAPVVSAGVDSAAAWLPAGCVTLLVQVSREFRYINDAAEAVSDFLIFA